MLHMNFIVYYAALSVYVARQDLTEYLQDILIEQTDKKIVGDKKNCIMLHQNTKIKLAIKYYLNKIFRKDSGQYNETTMFQYDAQPS